MSFPTSPVFQSATVTSIDPTLFSESVSGRTQARKVAGQKWQVKAKYPPMTQAEFMPVYSYVISKRGMLGTFALRIPVLDGSRGAASGTFLVNGAFTAGQTVVSINGGSGVLASGDFIKFDHDKVYMVIDHSGDSLTISPALVSPVADDETVVYENVAIKVRLKNDIQSFVLSNDGLFRYELDFIEVL